MPLYRYKALNARGETLDGQMEAASDAEVVLRLQEQGHLPVEAKLASEGGGGSSLKTLFKPSAFSGQRLVQFTQQLATLLGAALYWITPFTPLQAGAMALVINLMGFFGGLVMSSIKRDRGIKDWGHLIAGHGGFLDRLDSVVFSAPIFFHLVRYGWSAT